MEHTNREAFNICSFLLFCETRSTTNPHKSLWGGRVIFSYLHAINLPVGNAFSALYAGGFYGLHLQALSSRTDLKKPSSSPSKPRTCTFIEG
jgi:hypothetical protein